MRKIDIKTKCPKCLGNKGIHGVSERNYPATLPCPRCNSIGEVLLDSLTEAEKNPTKKPFFVRDDNP